jgi:hypothetical protein
VERPVGTDEPRRERIDRRRIGQVEAVYLYPFTPPAMPAPSRRSGRNDDGGARGRQGPRSLQTDADVSPGHDGDNSIEPAATDTSRAVDFDP